MGIEGQFAGLTARTQPAMTGDGRGNGYLYDIRRFANARKGAGV